MDFLPKKVAEYVCKYTRDEPLVLQQLHRETWQKVLHPRMLSGAFQGRVLSMLSKLIQPKTILEIGTYTGYSAICLCEGLQKGGTLYTIDNNEELQDIVNKYLELSGNAQKVQHIIGDALEEIGKINSTFDLVFIDADKVNYQHYFHKVIDKLNTRGVILSDNVLWSGKVVEELNPNDEETKSLLEYNQLLKEDKRLETVILPIRDGLSISIKK